MKQALNSLLHGVRLLAVAGLLAACATAENHYDPIEPVNRVTDGLNNLVDKVAMKPVTATYRAITPLPVQRSISNFYDNWAYPNTVLNDFLQGKGRQGVQDLGRFLVNSTIGIAGLFDVASSMGLEKHEEDFGQTLAVWGVPRLAYIVYPFLGPNSLRKTPDLVTSTLTNGLFWVSLAVAPPAALTLTALRYIDLRSRAMSATDMRDELALDPYVFTREAWFQAREHLIHDGATSGESDGWGDDDRWDDEDWSETPAETLAVAAAPSRAHGAIGVDGASPARAEVGQQAPVSRQGRVRLYHVILTSHAVYAEALRQQVALRKLRIATRIEAVTIHGRRWYRVQLPDPLPIEKAARMLDEMKRRTGLAGAWIAPAQSP
ncbi:MAG: VacJ family lipoprotein [Zetaproteobacteria bacterium]|nr:MAG: VacJ family lipoprotein [Zetaproteobacteria bacterium]